MNVYSIYMEGYRATGDSATARYVGAGVGHSFLEACRRYYIDSDYYDPDGNTYWGCRLFDNLEDAQRRFG